MWSIFSDDESSFIYTMYFPIMNAPQKSSFSFSLSNFMTRETQKLMEAIQLASLLS